MRADDEHPDLPLTFHYRVPLDAIYACGLLATGREAYDRARNSVLACAVATYDAGPELWTSYSRRPPFYAGLGRYDHTDYTYVYVTRAVDELRARGLIEEIRARPWDHEVTGLQSRFRATPKLISLVSNTWLERRPRPVGSELRLTDENGHLTHYANTDQTCRLLKRLQTVNGHMARCHLTLADTLVQGFNVRTTDHHWTVTRQTKEGPKVSVVRRDPDCRLNRIFGRGRFCLGGRFYAAYQNLSRPIRKIALLNSCPVAEPDFQGQHARLLYARRGLVCHGDPYDLNGYARDDVKAAFRVALNCRGGLNGAVWALFTKPTKEWGKDYEYTKALVHEMARKHVAIADDFGRDLGVHLMYWDSLIIEDVLRSCAKADLPCAPLHDGMMVQDRDECRVADIMAEAGSRFTGNSSMPVRTSSKMKTHTSSPSFPPFPSSPPSFPKVENVSSTPPGKAVQDLSASKGPDLPAPPFDTTPDRLPGLHGLYRWLDADLTPAAAKERTRLIAMVRTPSPGLGPTAGWDLYALGLLDHLRLSKRGQVVWLQTIRETGRTATGQPLDPDTVDPCKLRLVSRNPPDPRKAMTSPRRRTYPVRLPPKVSTASAPYSMLSQEGSPGLTHDQAVAELRAFFPRLQAKDVHVQTAPRRVVAR